MKALFRKFFRFLTRLCYRAAPDMFPRKSELVRQVKENLALRHELESAREDMLTLARANEENRRQHLILANEIVAKHAEIESLRLAAAFDPLTGLYNRRGAALEFERVLSGFDRRDYDIALHAGQPVGYQMSILVMDLNHFKEVNDTYGHAAGDVALVVIAEHLKRAFRPEDIVIRSGGDEFTAYLIGATKEGAVNRAEKLAALMLADDRLQFDAIRVSVSIGISHGRFATKRGGLQIVEDLKALADEAMYAAKEESRVMSSIVIAADAVYSDTILGNL